MVWSRLQQLLNWLEKSRVVSAIAYGVLTYQTAWLSLYYPLEFTVGCLSTIDDSKLKQATINYAIKRNVKFLPISINNSNVEFKIEVFNNEKCIRYGFSKIKGLSDKTKYIIAVRELVGGFKDFDDFYETIHNKEIISYINNYIKNIDKGYKAKNCPINVGDLKSLILAGAFDEFEENRFAIFNYFSKKYLKKEDIEENEKGGYIFKDEEYNLSHRYALELAYFDSYVSGNPLDKLPCDVLSNLSNNQIVILPGIINKKEVRKYTERRTGHKKDYYAIEFQTKNGLYYRANMFEPLYSKFKDEIFSTNLPKTIEKGNAIDKYNKIIKDNKKRLNCLYMFKGKYSSEYNNFTVIAIKKYI